MTQHINILIPLFIGAYMFLLGMGVPLPPRQFKGSKATACGGLLVIIIAAALVPSSDSRPVNTPAGRIAERLRQETKLPLRQDKDFSVIDITAEDQTLVYIFKIERDNADARELAARMGEELLKAACTKNEYFEMLKNGISVAFAYRDEDGRPAGRTVIRPATCHL